MHPEHMHFSVGSGDGKVIIVKMFSNLFVTNTLGSLSLRIAGTSNDCIRFYSDQSI